MSFSFLKSLSGNELKIFMIVAIFSDARHEFGNMEKLTHFNLSYPTILKNLEGLIDDSYIKKLDTGGICILRVAEKYHPLAEHMKKYAGSLTLFSLDEEEVKQEEEKKKRWWTKKDQDVLIFHYAIEQGVPQEKFKDWCKGKNPGHGNYAKNVRAAQFILNYCSSLEEAKITVTNCRIERSRSKLNWSLGGDVTRNIQNYAPKNGSLTGEKKWH